MKRPGSGGGRTLPALLRSLASALLAPARRSVPRDALPSRGTAGPATQEPSPGRSGPGATRELSGAEIAALRTGYQPRPDGDPDPGEVVWTWVPYAENDGRGKDRPVLIIARLDAESVAGCSLSTKPHSGFVSVGSGAWDGQGRESFLAPERVLRVTADGMRREGHVLPRDRFDRAVAAVRRAHGLPG